MTRMMGSNVGGGDEFVDIEDKTPEKELADSTSKREWEKVIRLYHSYQKAHTTVIDGDGRTTLHVALVEDEQVAEALLVAILSTKKDGDDDPLRIKDERNGNMALHVAASKGFVRVCKLIVGENEERKDLVKIKNKNGETPLFLAALNWNNRKGDFNKYTFAFLLNVLENNNIDDVLRYDGDSILHCAIRNQCFDLAIIVLRSYTSLAGHANQKGITPLKALAAMPSAFKSATHVSGWTLILYHCIIVESVDAESVFKSYVNEADSMLVPSWPIREYERFMKSNFPMNYTQPFRDTGIKYRNLELSEKNIYSGGQRWLPPNCVTSGQLINTLLGGFVGIFGLGPFGYDSVKKEKMKHKWSRQLLRELLKRPDAAFYNHGGKPTDFDQDIYQAYYGAEATRDIIISGSSDSKESEPAEEKHESAFVTAVRNGIVEMVSDILGVMPNAFYDKSLEDENVLVVAVRNRQPHAIEELKKQKRYKGILEEFISGAVDGEDNILHLAAQGLTEDQPRQIAGVALQMMWDSKWYEYIKDLVPEHYEMLVNKKEKVGKTPLQIFKESHKKLVDKSSEWLKGTSESCSVVAALITGVTFATACTVPGGNDDEGISPFANSPAFRAFAISSLAGLSFSVTALTMFLSILTSRKEVRDFRRSLPIKLLIGLSSLFVSIVAMFVSFCSGHYFLIHNAYKDVLFPLYAATALPVLFFAMAQFPLYYDLLVTTLFKVPNHGKGIGTR